METIARQVEDPALRPGRFTVVGLFQTTLDAEQALIALRKAARPPEQVSVVVRGRGDGEISGEGVGAVAQTVANYALDAVGGWLLGLAEMVVPGEGTYLVAGPLGAAFAGTFGRRGPDESSSDLSAGLEIPPGETGRGDDIKRILVDFGFNVDEAAYIDHRLDAGDTVVAVTTDDARQLQATRRLFGDHDAIHIGQARTPELVAFEAMSLLAAPIAAADGTEAVVRDATVPLRRLCDEGPREPWVDGTCGQPVVDRDGEEIGEVEELLADALQERDAEGRRHAVRYVVVAFGGLLGLGRHRVAVPVALLSLESGPVRLAIDGSLMHRAPDYDSEAPFSRREEQAIFAYFGVEPYWLTAGVG